MDYYEVELMLKSYRTLKNDIAAFASLQKIQETVRNYSCTDVIIAPPRDRQDSHMPKNDELIHLGDIDEKISSRRAVYEGNLCITKMVECLVAALNNDDKELIEALYFKGMTYDRACEVLDISRATVTARRKRAINRMVEMIK